MNKILSDNSLTSIDDSSPPIKPDESKSIVDLIIENIQLELTTFGDREVIIDNHDSKLQKNKVRHLSNFQPNCARLANALIKQNILRKGNEINSEIYSRFLVLSTLHTSLGDVVQTCMVNNTDFMIPVVASWMCGAVVSLGDPFLSPETIHRQIKAIDAKIVFASLNCLERVSQALDLLKDEMRPRIILVNADEKLIEERYRFVILK